MTPEARRARGIAAQALLEDETIKAGVSPIPPAIRKQLAAVFPIELLDRVRRLMAHVPTFFAADGAWPEYGRSGAYKFARLVSPGAVHRVRGAGGRPGRDP